jgi:uncharacterized protein (DUF2132 family)
VGGKGEGVVTLTWILREIEKEIHVRLAASWKKKLKIPRDSQKQNSNVSASVLSSVRALRETPYGRENLLIFSSTKVI